MSRCWICGSVENREFLPSTLGNRLNWEDVKISDSRYGRTARIVECLACGFRFADPLPVADLIPLYQAMEDEEYAEEWEVRIPSFRRVARQCTTLFPHAATLLDIGAGSGLLSLAAREAGLQAWGVEPSTFLVRRARVEHGVELLEGTYPHPSLSGMRFDIIALLDVLEHVPHPLALLRNVREALNPGGLVVLGTPNCRSLAARLLGRRWWHYRAAHVGYFDRRTLTETLHRVGLAVQARTPYPRHFSMQYLLGRMKRYAPLGPGLRGLALRFPGGRVPGSIGLNLGDSDLYIARGPRGDAL